MLKSSKPAPDLRIEEVDYSPEELAEFLKQRAAFERNWKWFQTQIVEMGRSLFGKHVCIANEEAFVADTPREALALATAAHPEDRGRFRYYFPTHRLPRIYAAVG